MIRNVFCTLFLLCVSDVPPHLYKVLLHLYRVLVFFYADGFLKFKIGLILSAIISQQQL